MAVSSNAMRNGFMATHSFHPAAHRPLADHSTDRRMILLAAMALVVGTGGAMGAWVLIQLIAVATNLFWFGRVSADHTLITQAHVGVWWWRCRCWAA
jgi:hypothetical protein